MSLIVCCDQSINIKGICQCIIAKYIPNKCRTQTNNANIEKGTYNTSTLYSIYDAKSTSWTNLTKFWVPWPCVVALLGHSGHKLTRFNFVQHNGSFHNAHGTVQGLKHVKDMVVLPL